jgi:outer membrane PBP1 activator LpoA protein
MFSINIKLKFALIALFLVGGVLLAIFQGFWYALPFILVGLGLMASYLLLGTVQSAENRLNLIWKPEWLYKTNKAFYNILKGSLAMNNKDNNAAEAYFKKAEAIDLPTDDEKAMVQLQLANINAQKQKWNAAKVYFMNAKKLKVTQQQIKDQIAQFDLAFKQRGQMKNAQGQGRRQMMQPGGKRRRPKMR